MSTQPGELPSEFRAAGKVARFSADGVELTDRRGRTASLAWDDVARVGEVRFGLRRRLGLIGRIGRIDQTTIPLGAIDPHWTYGAMGAWVRRHRPDLL
ncbi:hypothetical protein [Flindersiella endophytica]